MTTCPKCTDGSMVGSKSTPQQTPTGLTTQAPHRPER